LSYRRICGGQVTARLALRGSYGSSSPESSNMALVIRVSASLEKSFSLKVDKR